MLLVLQGLAAWTQHRAQHSVSQITGPGFRSQLHSPIPLFCDCAPGEAALVVQVMGCPATHMGDLSQLPGSQPSSYRYLGSKLANRDLCLLDLKYTYG